MQQPCVAVSGGGQKCGKVGSGERMRDQVARRRVVEGALLGVGVYYKSVENRMARARTAPTRAASVARRSGTASVAAENEARTHTAVSDDNGDAVSVVSVWCCARGKGGSEENGAGVGGVETRVRAESARVPLSSASRFFQCSTVHVANQQYPTNVRLSCRRSCEGRRP